MNNYTTQNIPPNLRFFYLLTRKISHLLELIYHRASLGMQKFKGLISLVKKKRKGPRQIFFYLYRDAQHSLKFPTKVVPTPLFLPIHIWMT